MSDIDPQDYEELELRVMMAEDKARHYEGEAAELRQRQRTRRTSDQLEAMAWIWIGSIFVTGVCLAVIAALYWTSIPNPHPRTEVTVSCPSGQSCPTIPGANP